MLRTLRSQSEQLQQVSVRQPWRRPAVAVARVPDADKLAADADKAEAVAAETTTERPLGEGAAGPCRLRAGSVAVAFVLTKSLPLWPCARSRVPIAKRRWNSTSPR